MWTISIQAVTAAFLVIATSNVYAAEYGSRETPLDLSFKFGGAGGTITRPRSNKTPEQKFIFAGAPFAIAYNRGISPSLESFAQIGVLLDVPNKQVSRQGTDLGLIWHLWGGSRLYYAQNTQKFVHYSRSWQSFSLIGQVGLQRYGASNKDDTSQNISGSVFEIPFGFGYRNEWGSRAVGMEFLSTYLNLPASIERIDPVLGILYLYWRSAI